MIDLIARILTALRQAWLILRNTPRVTCDVRSVRGAKWMLDCVWNDDGSAVVAEGIRIEVFVEFLLANDGPVSTTIKDIHVDIRHGEGSPCRLAHFPTRDMKDGAVNRIEIPARGTWGPATVELGGTCWEMDEPSERLGAELVVEPVAQCPVRKNITLRF